MFLSDDEGSANKSEFATVASSTFSFKIPPQTENATFLSYYSTELRKKDKSRLI
jgi:hypothetical protein